MRIREYQLDKIDEARQIQQECLRLHMPCPPVLHWKYEIKNADGSIDEVGRGKANSYTRNALNLLAWNMGLCSPLITSATVFSDGIISNKITAGTINRNVLARLIYTGLITDSANFPKVYVGTNTSAESLDSYALPTTTGLTDGGTLVTSSWDAIARKLTTTIIASWTNTSGGSKNIVESAIRVAQEVGTTYLLMVRDVFDAIALADGQTINWTYTTEVAYPEP